MDNATKSLFIKLGVMGLTAIATYLHMNVPDAQLYAFTTDIVDAGLLIYGYWRSHGTKLVPKSSVAISAENVVNKNALGVGGVALVTSSDSNPTTVAAKVVGVLLVAFVLSAFLAGGAQAQVKLVKPTGNIVQDIAAATGSRTTITGAPVTDIQNFMNAKFLPDLQYALKLATASRNNVTADCYQAWIDIITTQQTAVQTKNPDGTTVDVPMPDPHVITEFEKLVELRNALQPESPFMVKCSPVASMVKLDIAKFMGVVISGGAGLATLVPGL